MVEGLCCELPILVNSKLLGGWKYVNKKSGIFFKNEKDISNGIEYILNNKLEPRKYYLENYGRENTGKRLKEFIQKHFSNDINIDKYEYLYL